MRLIGDIHQWISKQHPKKGTCYLDIIKDCDESIQLGDMGFRYDDLNDVSLNHRWYGGNHENHNLMLSQKNNLGHFGIYKDYFFIRGAFSIDKAHRTPGHDWFPEEELNDEQMRQCLKLYKKTKPDIVLSHDCPLSISRSMFPDGTVLSWFGFDKETFQTKTQLFLDECFKIHKPREWYFAHYHQNRKYFHNGTKFTCIGELCYVDIPSE